MMNRRQGLVLLSAPWLPLAARAELRLEGQTIADRASVAGHDLVLNGAGVRYKAWFKGYLAALYLPRKATQADQVLAMSGPKRLQLRMLHDVPTQEFIKAFDKGVARNTPAAELPALRDRMARFDALLAALGRVRQGDVVDLDQVPGQGLHFLHNGRRRGDAIEGDDLYAALLRIFIGDKPTQDELKAALLGGKA